MDTHPVISVKDLRPGLKNLSMVLITLEIGKPSTTKDGHEVRSIRVADRTGSVNLSIWDEPGTLLQPGDIVRVHKAYASLFKNSLTLYIGKGGEIYKVGDFCLHFSETPNMSEESFANPAAGVDGGGGSGTSQQGGGSGGGRGAPSSGGPAEGGKPGGPIGMLGGPRGERPTGGGGVGYSANNNGTGQRMGMQPAGAILGMKAHAGPLNHHYNNHNNNFAHQAPHLLHSPLHQPLNNLAVPLPDQVVTQNGVKLHRK